MKKILLIGCLTAPFAANAGIPVIDIGSLTQMITEGAIRANEFKENILEARNRLNQMKQQGTHYKDMVDGHFDVEKVLNDPNANKFMALSDWKKIYDDVEDIAELREEFYLFSDDPKKQKIYDDKLRQYSAQKRFYNSSVARNKKMTDLLNEFATATTPAKKEDIANSLRFEQTQLQNDAQMMASLNSLMEQQRRFEVAAAAEEKMRKWNNEGFPRSQ
ncbi:type IV secretion system protein [Shewanella septentrionalis]|uniref:Type IV secretion system protein n=1 Tax=Shewanella septentrionalis TaxID=2952223 RepID=A0A9X3AVX7_9GAMM|nr:type IV secretion system protein [Shewanella septentrionalis]